MPTKHERIIQLLDQHKLDGLLIQRVGNFNWATDGADSYINRGSTVGEASLFVTRMDRHLISNNIEATRLEHEEELKIQGWQFHVNQWDQPQMVVEQLTKGLKIGADTGYPGAVDFSGELVIARSYLTLQEQANLRECCQFSGLAIEEAARAVKPGMSEYEISGLIAEATERRGVATLVILVATDERIFNFRHPLPTAKKIDKYAMLIYCGRYKGLVSAVTRLVHFGPLPDDVRRKAEAVAYVDAAMIAATRPGVTAADVFQAAKEAYTTVGYPEEWRLHHQGGPIGYDPREFLATDAADVPVGVGQAYAWNPSITGSKSEDTILVGERDNEIITATGDWPTLSIDIDGQTIKRPAIMEI